MMHVNFKQMIDAALNTTGDGLARHNVALAINKAFPGYKGGIIKYDCAAARVEIGTRTQFNPRGSYVLIGPDNFLSEGDKLYPVGKDDKVAQCERIREIVKRHDPKMARALGDIGLS